MVDGAKRYSGFRVPNLHAFAAEVAGGRQAPVAAERHGDRMEVVSGQAGKGGSVLPVPDFHHPVTSPREQAAVATERNGVGPGRSLVARFGKQGVIGRRQVPDLHRLVSAARGKVLAVAVEHDAEDGTLVCGEGLDLLARSAVPDLDGPVPACGGE